LSGSPPFKPVTLDNVGKWMVSVLWIHDMNQFLPKFAEFIAQSHSKIVADNQTVNWLQQQIVSYTGLGDLTGFCTLTWARSGLG